MSLQRVTRISTSSQFIHYDDNNFWCPISVFGSELVCSSCLNKYELYILYSLYFKEVEAMGHHDWFFMIKSVRSDGSRMSIGKAKDLCKNRYADRYQRSLYKNRYAQVPKAWVSLPSPKGEWRENINADLKNSRIIYNEMHAILLVIIKKVKKKFN